MLLIPFPVAISMRVYVIIMGVIEFFGTLGAGGDNVSHVCHLGGMLVGYLYLRRGSYLYPTAIAFPIGSAAACCANSKSINGAIATNRLARPIAGLTRLLA